MGIQKITKIILGIVVGFLIAYDFYAWNTGGTEATISWVVMEWSYQSPAMTFGIGFICGHLFWQMKGRKKIGPEK